jgi:hypothetical protein
MLDQLVTGYVSRFAVSRAKQKMYRYSLSLHTWYVAFLRRIIPGSSTGLLFVATSQHAESSTGLKL